MLSDYQRQILDDLDITKGTGIFTNNKKVDSIDQPTVIIGLGGLGGKTLKKLKEQIKKRVNIENNTIRFLAIDSFDDELSYMVESGDLEKHEVLLNQ